MVQHQDPLVWNAFLERFQNASAPGPDGQPLGLAVGTPGGSVAALLPSIGQTVSVDGTYVCTILASASYPSGAGSEQFPGYTASVILNEGAVNEQVGHLAVSGLASSSAQASLMLSESSDGTIHGSVRVGTIAPSVSGGITTYDFTSMHQTWPHAQQFQLASGFGLYATNQQLSSLGEAEGWNFMTGLSGNFAAAGSAIEWTPQYHFSPLHGGKVFFRGLIATPGATAVNGVTFFNLPVSYRPANYCRWAVSNPDDNTTGICLLRTDGNMQVFGFTGANSKHIDISGHASLA